LSEGAKAGTGSPYSVADLRASFKKWTLVSYGQSINLWELGIPELVFTAFSSGSSLGAALWLLEVILRCTQTLKPTTAPHFRGARRVATHRHLPQISLVGNLPLDGPPPVPHGPPVRQTAVIYVADASAANVLWSGRPGGGVGWAHPRAGQLLAAGLCGIQQRLGLAVSTGEAGRTLLLSMVVGGRLRSNTTGGGATAVETPPATALLDTLLTESAPALAAVHGVAVLAVTDQLEWAAVLTELLEPLCTALARVPGPGALVAVLGPTGDQVLRYADRSAEWLSPARQQRLLDGKAPFGRVAMPPADASPGGGTARTREPVPEEGFGAQAVPPGPHCACPRPKCSAAEAVCRRCGLGVPPRAAAGTRGEPVLQPLQCVTDLAALRELLVSPPARDKPAVIVVRLPGADATMLAQSVAEDPNPRSRVLWLGALPSAPASPKNLQGAILAGGLAGALRWSRAECRHFLETLVRFPLTDSPYHTLAHEIWDV
jgi:hypothetical protein